MDDIELHRGLVDRVGSYYDLNTPALIIDLDAMDRNIAAMAALIQSHDRKLRPHSKTHKSVDIAKRQIAHGAVGQCCAKIGEAEVMVDAGIDGVLITSPFASSTAIARLVCLAKRAEGLIVTIDNLDVTGKIIDALEEADASVDVFIDIDPGLHRTGVASPAAAVELARLVSQSSRLNYRGVQFYCGPQQHIASYEERRDEIVALTRYLEVVIAELTANCFAPEIVSGAGTGTHRIDLELGVFTELQLGSYIFMDTQYLECALTADNAVPLETSLGVVTRVVSANHADMVTIDAGIKALSTDGGLAVARRGVPDGVKFGFLGDEHGALRGKGVNNVLRPGDIVTLTVPHCDPTVNLYDNYHVIRGDTLVDIWSVSARGRSR